MNVCVAPLLYGRGARARASVLFLSNRLSPSPPPPSAGPFLANRTPCPLHCPLTPHPRDVHSLKPGGDRVHSQFYRCFDRGGGGGGGDARFRFLLLLFFLFSNPGFSPSFHRSREKQPGSRPRSEFLEVRRCRGKMSRRRCRLSKAIEIASSYAAAPLPLGCLVKSPTARPYILYVYSSF